MKLLFHFAYTNFSNTYIVGPEEPGNAILIDPGVMDIQLLDLIEHHNYYVKYIFATHAHKGHINGMGTILKIYRAEIYSGSDSIFDFPSHKLQHGEIVNLDGIEVEVIALPGHTGSSLAYKIKNMIFTGDALSAGTVGSTVHNVAEELNRKSVIDRVLSLDESNLIFPGHGPPSSVKIERQFNPFLV
jgi:glyoxylase-like metal-dependent hydrolase (beta-lactamase superfamily II)